MNCTYSSYRGWGGGAPVQVNPARKVAGTAMSLWQSFLRVRGHSSTEEQAAFTERQSFSTERTEKRLTLAALAVLAAAARKVLASKTANNEKLK